MSFQEQTRSEIEEILRREFSPLFIEVLDDSAAHRGHAEALMQPKAGHFKVSMSSQNFNGLNQVKRHRLVYNALRDLMDSKIHAISLNLRATDEQP